MTLFITAVIAGLGVGAVYGLLALSYAVIYRSTGIFNVAQGDLMTAGILAAYVALDVWKVASIVAFLFILAVVVGLSIIEEFIAVRPFLSRVGAGEHSLGWFIATLGFGLIVTTLCTAWYGSRPILAIPGLFKGSAPKVGSVAISPQYAFAFGVFVIVTVLLEIFYRKSWLGTAMRAAAEDREMAALRGIAVRRTSPVAFALAGTVTAIAAFLVAPIVSADMGLGLTFTLKAFVVLAIGGFGSLRGCVVGALLLGVSEQVFDLYVSPYYEIFAGLAVLLVVLVIRPNGLFGARRMRLV
jgi:branched-chain amino acid transport system permease protein